MTLKFDRALAVGRRDHRVKRKQELRRDLGEATKGERGEPGAALRNAQPRTSRRVISNHAEKCRGSRGVSPFSIRVSYIVQGGGGGYTI